METKSNDTGKPDASFSWKSVFRISNLKNLLLYVLIPLLGLVYLARPIGDAVRSEDAAVYRILLEALGTVCLNWLVYAAVRRKIPSLAVFSDGVFFLLLVLVVEGESLPGYHHLMSSLALIGGCLALTFLFMFSFWLSDRPSRPAHAAAVGLWLIIGALAFFMAVRILTDIETHNVSGDTWLTLGFLLILLPAALIRKIVKSCRRAMTLRADYCLARGWISQIIGISRLNRFDDTVVDYFACIQYFVDDVPYEIRAEITRFTMRIYDRKDFIGWEVLVYYNPEKPEQAYSKRIDRHFFDDRYKQKKFQADSMAPAG